MSDTPEIDKNAAANDDWRTILAFMEWARENGYNFTKTVTYTDQYTSVFNDKTHEYQVPVEVPVHLDGALYEFFGIDPVKLELERRAVLADAVAANEQHRDTYTVHPAPEDKG